MKFIKRLIILSGAASKGTLMIERNAYGVWIRLSTFNLPKTAAGYELVLIMGDRVVLKELPYDGKLSFELKSGEIDVMHAAVVTGKTVELYGTNDGKRMWPSNILDIVGREHDKKKNTEIERYEAPQEIYSGRRGGVADYFFDIVPSDTPKYADDAIAENNYFENEVTQMSELKNFTSAREVAAAADDSFSYNSDQDRNLEERKDTGPKDEPEQAVADIPAEMPADSIKAPPIKTRAAGQDPLDERGEGMFFDPSRAVTVEERFDTLEEDTEIRTEPGKKNMTVNNDGTGEEPMDRARATLRMPGSDEQNGNERPHSDYAPRGEARESSRTAGGGSRKEASFLGDYTPKDSTCFNAGREGLVFEPPGTRGADGAPFVAAKSNNSSYNRKATFFENSRRDIEKLFNDYPKFTVLEKLIPGSRWVRVDYDNAGKYYVVGITEDYLCYGVPASYTAVPPRELEGYCQWLPTSPDQPAGEGFWLMYQDLKTGETLRASRR